MKEKSPRAKYSITRSEKTRKKLCEMMQLQQPTKERPSKKLNKAALFFSMRNTLKHTSCHFLFAFKNTKHHVNRKNITEDTNNYST